MLAASAGPENCPGNFPNLIIPCFPRPGQPPPGGFPEGLENITASIYTQPPESEVRNRLAAEVLRRYRPYAEALTLRAYFPSYRERLFVVGRDVTLVRGKEREEVHVQALADDGSLVVRDAVGHTRHVASGEVSLRF